METPNANKICTEQGGYTRCLNCPLYSACAEDYPTTEEFEKTIEKAAIEYLKGKQQ